MISLHNRLASSFCLGMLLLSLAVLDSCKPQPPDQNPRDELVRALKGANIEGYRFATREEDNQIITSLTNGALRDPVKFDGSNSVVIGYASVKDKKTNAVKTFKAEVVKTGNNFTLQITDLGVGALATKFTFPNPRPCDPNSPFNTNQDCIDDYNCRIFPGLLREANRTCQPQVFELECCTKNGPGFAELILIRPTRLQCAEVFPFDIDTLVLSQ